MFLLSTKAATGHQPRVSESGGRTRGTPQDRQAVPTVGGDIPLIGPEGEARHARAAQKNFLALRVVDDKAFERMYNGDELGNAMRLEEGPMRVDSASDDEEEEVVEAPPEPPEDAVLAAVLERRSSMVASAIATDTLLVENDAERLEKGEEADAIDEYERERDGRPTRAEEEHRGGAAPVRGGGGAARGGGAGGAGARRAREKGAAARGLDAAPEPQVEPRHDHDREAEAILLS